MLFIHPLDFILGQTSKVKILRFLSRSQAEMNGREIAKAVGTSHVKCHAALQELTTHGLVTMRRVGRSILYGIDADNVQFKSLLQPLFKNESQLFNMLKSTLFENLSGSDIVSMIVFGSVAKGNAQPNSDIDLLLIVANSKSIQKIRNKLERTEEKVIERFGNQLSPILLTQHAFRIKYNKGNGLYREIAKSGIVIHGQAISEVLTDAR